MEERIQKILSARGIASRRKAEEYIRAGLVTVNGKPAVIGQKADPEKDAIEVDGSVIEARRELLYFVLNKPVGVVTTNVEGPRGKQSKQGKQGSSLSSLPSLSSLSSPTVRDLLPEPLRGKIFPIGRLDKDSSGLLLLTNDGVLAYRLTHPKFEHEKEYEVDTGNPITEGMLDKMREGMTISGERTKPARAVKIDTRKFRITLTEGRNRQIRRMCQKVGAPVDALRRIRITTLMDSALPPGEIRLLTESERHAILQSVGL